jgi:hypothetical protein
MPSQFVVTGSPITMSGTISAVGLPLLTFHGSATRKAQRHSRDFTARRSCWHDPDS